MSFFVFRTALPFGYGAFALVLVCVAAFGLVQGWRGLRARPLNRVRALTGLALLILAGFVTAANLVYEDSVELNPVVSVADLKGVWRDGPAVLDLGSDGTYSCSGAGNCTQLGSSGRWIHDGNFLIQFTRKSDGRPLIQRVVRAEGELRLTDEVNKPDLWVGAMTFRHRAPE